MDEPETGWAIADFAGQQLPMRRGSQWEAADVEPQRRRPPPGIASVLFNASQQIGVALAGRPFDHFHLGYGEQLPDALGALYRARGQR